MYAIEYGGDERETWRLEARCADGTGQLTALFFSEALDDIARAKAFCAGCDVREACLEAAVARREPWGVWGGELLVNGRVIANKRRRGVRRSTPAHRTRCRRPGSSRSLTSHETCSLLTTVGRGSQPPVHREMADRGDDGRGKTPRCPGRAPVRPRSTVRRGVGLRRGRTARGCAGPCTA